MPKTHGFTLMELLLTIAILSVLTVLAVPSLQQMIERNRVTTTTNDIVASFLLTRSTAVTQGQDTVIRRVSGDWGKGWRVIDANNVTIHRHSNTSTSLSISREGPNLGNAVTYTPQGRAATALVAGTDYFEVSAGDYSRCVNFSAAGRPATGDCP